MKHFQQQVASSHRFLPIASTRSPCLQSPVLHLLLWGPDTASCGATSYTPWNTLYRYNWSVVTFSVISWEPAYLVLCALSSTVIFFCILDSKDETYNQQEDIFRPFSCKQDSWAWMRDLLWLQSKPTRTPTSASHPGKYRHRHGGGKQKLFLNSFKSTFREDAELITSSTALKKTSGGKKEEIQDCISPLKQLQWWMACSQCCFTVDSTKWEIWRGLMTSGVSLDC